MEGVEGVGRPTSRSVQAWELSPAMVGNRLSDSAKKISSNANSIGKKGYSNHRPLTTSCRHDSRRSRLHPSQRRSFYFPPVPKLTLFRVLRVFRGPFIHRLWSTVC